MVKREVKAYHNVTVDTNIKEGDKVTVRKGLKIGELSCGLRVTEGMVNSAGEEFVVRKVEFSDSGKVRIDLEDSCWFWTTELLNVVEEIETKFNVGDYARVIDDLDGDTTYSYGTTTEMLALQGKIVRIADVRIDWKGRELYKVETTRAGIVSCSYSADELDMIVGIRPTDKIGYEKEWV